LTEILLEQLTGFWRSSLHLNRSSVAALPENLNLTERLWTT